MSVTGGLSGIEFRNDLTVGQPGPGEILVRVGAAGVNFSDILMLQDRYQVRPPRPFVPGQEISGWVEAVGDGCALAVGEFVAGEIRTGGFAELVLLSEKAAIPMSGAIISPAQAAALPVAYGTALVALTESTRVQAGETVLVHAAGGGVGLAAVQIAKALGATVIAAASTDEKRALAIVNGADHAIDYSAAGWHENVKDITGGRGVDIVVDTVGGDTTSTSLRCIARGGRLLVIGFASGTISMIPANLLLLKRATAIGVYWTPDEDKYLWARVKARMKEMMAVGAIRPAVVPDYRLEDFPKALDDLANRRILGKAVLSVRDGQGSE